MKFGNRINLFVFYFFLKFNLLAEDRITSTPLLNIEEIKPSFEELKNLMSFQIVKRKSKQKLVIL